MKTLKRTWADISLDNLEYNYRSIRAHLPSGTRFLGVMKADAYGHGAVPVSRALADLGAEYLAVSNLEEAVQIRRGEVRLPILILGYTPPEYAANMIFLDITQEVHSLAYAQELNEALASRFMVINMPVISADSLEKLLKATFPKLRAEYARQLAELFQEIRKKCDSSEISTKALDLRGLIAAVHLTEQGLSLGEALEMGILNKSFDDTCRLPPCPRPSQGTHPPPCTVPCARRWSPSYS